MPDMVQLVPLDAISESAASSSDANGADGSTARDRRRRRTAAARKKVERAAHEHAPGLATMVAGHHHRMSRRTSANSNGNRRSGQQSPFQHLVADDNGDLHDPEYEAIRIVRREPSISGSSDDSVVSSSTEEESTNNVPFGNYRYQPPAASNRRPINAAAPSFRTTSQSTRSSDNTSNTSRRTYAGSGVTYLAPSITMPPNLSSSYASSMMPTEQYNPFTYVPTTSRPSEAFNHSLRPHSSRRYDYTPSTSASHPNGHLHSYVPAISPISEVAPPIPWSSSFTPSAEHPERHRTRQHDASASGIESMKRNFQKVKLDVSFGLLKLKKNK